MARVKTLVNFPKFKKDVKNLLKDDKDYVTRVNLVNNIGAGAQFVNRDVDNDLKTLGKMIGEFRPIILPKMEKLEELAQSKDEDIAYKAKEMIRMMKYFGLDGIKTAAVMPVSENGGIITDGMFINEDFFKKIEDFWGIDINSEQMQEIANTHPLKAGKLMSQDMPPNHKDFIYTVTALLAHEVTHILFNDLLRVYHDYKYYNQIANLTEDFRIHELTTGLTWRNIFDRLHQFFPNGIWLETFQKTHAGKLGKDVYSIVKEHLSGATMKELSKKYDAQLLSQINFDKLDKEKGKAKKIIDDIDDWMDRFRNQMDDDIKEKVEGKTPTDITLEYTKAVVDKELSTGKPTINRFFYIAEIFMRTSNLIEFTKGDGNYKGGEGGGIGEGVELPHDENNGIKPTNEEFDNEYTVTEKEDDFIHKKSDKTDRLNERAEDATKGKGTDFNTFRGVGVGSHETTLTKKDLLADIFNEIDSSIKMSIRSNKRRVVQRVERKFNPAMIPEYCISYQYMYRGRPHVIPTGAVSRKAIYYDTDPIFLVLINNSSSMATKDLIGVMKNAVVSNLCEKGTKTLAIDWDYGFQDVVGLNKESPNYQSNLDKFMKFRGQGGTGNFGEFYAKLPEYLDKHKDKFEPALKEIGLTIDDVKERWKNGEVVMIYMTDAEIGHFDEEVMNNIGENESILHEAGRKMMKIFNFIVPSNMAGKMAENAKGLRKYGHIYEIHMIDTMLIDLYHKLKN